MKNKSTKKDLYHLLEELKDERRGQGKMYSLPLILIIVIMGIMNGAKSERAILRFAENNKEDLIKHLQIARKRIPTRNLIRYIMQKIDFQKLEKIFAKWAKNYVSIEEKDWISVDGKAIKGTTKNANDSGQNFKSLVSVFASKRKQVIAVSRLETKKQMRFQ